MNPRTGIKRQEQGRAEKKQKEPNVKQEAGGERRGTRAELQLHHVDTNHLFVSVHSRSICGYMHCKATTSGL